jgi:hypothetical protein
MELSSTAMSTLRMRQTGPSLPSCRVRERAKACEVASHSRPWLTATRAAAAGRPDHIPETSKLVGERGREGGEQGRARPDLRRPARLPVGGEATARLYRHPRSRQAVPTRGGKGGGREGQVPSQIELAEADGVACACLDQGREETERSGGQDFGGNVHREHGQPGV